MLLMHWKKQSWLSFSISPHASVCMDRTIYPILFLVSPNKKTEHTELQTDCMVLMANLL